MRFATIALTILLSVGLMGCKGHTKESLNAEGETLFQQGNFNGAIVHFKNALEKDQNFTDARFNLGLSYVETGKLDQAEREFQKLQLQNPHDARISFQLARIANFQNKPALAVPLLEEILKQNPDDPATLEQLAVAASISGDLISARQHLEAALSHEPDRVSARLALIHNLMNQGEWDKARETLDSLLAKDPKNQSGLHMLAHLEARKRDPEGMLDVYGRISSIYPNDLFARYKEGSLLIDKGEGEKVKASAEAMIKEFPDKAEGYRLLGLCLAREGRFDEAMTSLQKSLRIQPDLETYYLLGLVSYYQGNLEMAVTQFQTVLDYNPGFVQPMIMQAEIFLRQGRGAEAQIAAEKVAMNSPGDYRGPTLKGDALLVQGKPKEAVAQYAKALELAPSHYGLLFRSGLLKLALGDADGEADMRKALEASPKAVEVRLALHAHYMRSGRSEEALQMLTDGLDGGRADAVLYNALAKASFGSKDAAGAEAYFLKARQADSAYLQTYYNTAILKLSQGKPDEAMIQYDLAIGVSPGDVRALVASAIILESQDQDEAAEARLEKARSGGDLGAALMLSQFLQRHGKSDRSVAVLEEELSKKPSSLALIAAKANLHVARKETEKAMSMFGQMEAADPWAGIMERTRAHMVMGEIDKAEAAARQLIALKPDKAQSYLPLVGVLEARQDRVGAEEVLRKALKLEPENPRLMVSLGEFQLRGRDADNALKSFEQALAIAPSNVSALTGKGAALQLQGKSLEAIRTYRQAVQVRDDHVPALNNLAMLLADKEETRLEAVNMATAAFTRASGNFLVMDTLGYALVRNNEPGKGLEMLERALALSPGNPVILYHKALAQAGLGRPAEARESLEAALAGRDFEERVDAEALLKKLESGS